MRQCDRHEIGIEAIRKDAAQMRADFDACDAQNRTRWLFSDEKWKAQRYTNEEVVQLRSDFRLANFKITGLVLLASVVGNFVAAWIFARLT